MGIVNHPNWAKINTYSSAFVGTIKTAQDAFFAANGRYFQGVYLLGPTAQPDGTIDVQTINTAVPTDTGVAWKDFLPTVFKANLKIPIQLRIDVFKTTNGWGWILQAEIWIAGLGPDTFGNDGNHWMYRHFEGAENPGGIFDTWYIQADN